jgi:hypothetical protein
MLSDQQWARIEDLAMLDLNHPCRLAIVRYLYPLSASTTPALFARLEENQVEKTVPAEEEGGEPVTMMVPEWPIGTVSYHFRMLKDKGVIKEIKTTQHRGAIAHHYQMTPYARRVLKAMFEHEAVAA